MKLWRPSPTGWRECAALTTSERSSPRRTRKGKMRRRSGGIGPDDRFPKADDRRGSDRVLAHDWRLPTPASRLHSRIDAAITGQAEHTGRLAELQKRRTQKTYRRPNFDCRRQNLHHAASPIPESATRLEDEVDMERNRKKRRGPNMKANESEIPEGTWSAGAGGGSSRSGTAARRK